MPKVAIFMKHTFAKYLQNPGSKLTWANPSKGYFGEMWPKPGKQGDFLRSAHGNRATNSQIAIKPVL